MPNIFHYIFIIIPVYHDICLENNLVVVMLFEQLNLNKKK